MSELPETTGRSSQASTTSTEVSPRWRSAAVPSSHKITSCCRFKNKLRHRLVLSSRSAMRMTKGASGKGWLFLVLSADSLPGRRAIGPCDLSRHADEFEREFRHCEPTPWARQSRQGRGTSHR